MTGQYDRTLHSCICAGRCPIAIATSSPPFAGIVKRRRIFTLLSLLSTRQSRAPASSQRYSQWLSAFHALTYGVKYSQKLAGLGGRAESEFSVRAEYYQETFNEQVPVPVGLQGLDLYPALKAVLVQIGYRF